MRRLFLIVSLALSAAISASATVINVGSSSTGRTAVDALLNTLADGDLFLVGSFSNVPGISLSSGSIANILANGGWSQFGNSMTTTSIFGNGGKLSDTATDDSSVANAFNNLDAYIVIFNASTSANATQIGIFRASSSATNPWVFPVNGSVGNSVNIGMDETSIAAIGGVGSVSATPQRFILTNVVPEPSSFVMTASGLVGLLGYRRLRRIA